MADDLIERLHVASCQQSGTDDQLAELLEAAGKRVQELEHPTAMDEAIAAGDGTLHGAIDYWQGRAERAEAELADKAAERLAYDAVIDLLFERLPDAKCMGELPGVVDELRQQLAAAQADAERYRWLRQEASGIIMSEVFDTAYDGSGPRTRDDLDAAIDTARGKA